MQELSGYTLQFQELFGQEGPSVQMPGWWFDALLAWVGIFGLLLWLFGRRLVRPALGVAGAAIGAVAVLQIVAWMSWGGRTEVWAVGGAAVGAAVFGLVLWRVVLALSLAAVAAVALPWLAMVFQGIERPPVWEPVRDAAWEMRQIVLETKGVSGNEPPADEATVGAAQPTRSEPAAPPQITQAPADAPPQSDTPDAGADQPRYVDQPMAEAAEKVRAAWSEWWNHESMGIHEHYWLLGAAIGGGVLALMMGFALPAFTASFLTSLSGCLLMAGGVWRLASLGGDRMTALLPSTPAGFAAMILVATLIGTALQWTFFRKKTDK